jgi:hypothetical protein
MSFANINLGTTAGDNTGDSLRVAFDKINRNFYQVNSSLNTTAANVQTVAGRTGNVVLTVTDIAGAVAIGQVSNIVLNNLTNYANITYVNTRLPNISTINSSISSAIDAEDIPAIRTSIGSLQTQITANSATLSALQTNAVSQASQITGANVAIITANTAMKAYVDANAVVQANNIAGAWATANAAVSASALVPINANIVSIQSNVTAANLTAYWLANTVNSGLVPAVSSLWANLTAANTASTTANTAMKAYVDSANTAVKGYVDSANTVMTNYVGNQVTTANTAMKSYADARDTAITTAWTANAAAQAGLITSLQSNAGAQADSIAGANAAIITANTAMKAYADAQDTAITTAWTANAGAQADSIAGANAAIITANTAMKSYADARDTAITTAWTANAGAQADALVALTANAASQNTTLNTLTGNIANLSNVTLNLASSITGIITGSGFITPAQLTANLTTINSNVANVAVNVTVHTGNIISIGNSIGNILTNQSFIQSNLITLYSNAASQHAQIIAANTYNVTRTDTLTGQLSSNVTAANAQISTMGNTLTNTVSDVTSLKNIVYGFLGGTIGAYNDANVSVYLASGNNATITSINANITAANAAIITANTAMKGYVDAVTTAWTSNAGAQANQLTGANAAIVTANTAMRGYVDARTYTNANVTSYLVSATGNISAGNITVTGAINAKKSVTTSIQLGAVSGTVTVDVGAGDYQNIITDGNVTLAFSNWPTTGTCGTVAIEANVVSTAHNITLPSNIQNVNGITGYYSATRTWSPPITGVYLFTFNSGDNGTGIYIAESNPILRPFNASNENIAVTSNTALSLGTTYSTYNASGNGSAFLGNGVAGQIKVLGSAVGGASNVWTVSTASASWAGGNIRFNSAGSTVTLLWNIALRKWVPINAFNPPSFV